jgi:hypothetical protein
MIFMPSPIATVVPLVSRAFAMQIPRVFRGFASLREPDDGSTILLYDPFTIRFFKGI